MIIGSAFTGIVNSLVNSLIMPLLSLITGKTDYTAMQWVIGAVYDEAGALVEGTIIPYGQFIQAIFNFAAIAVCIFLLVKMINKLNNLKKKEEAAAPAPVKEPARLCPYCFQEIHKEATRCPHCTSEIK